MAAGGAGDRDHRVPVRRVDLLDVARRHPVSLGGEAIAGDDHAVGILEGQYGRAVAEPRGTVASRNSSLQLSRIWG